MKFLAKHLLFPVLANALALFLVQYALEDRGFVITRGVYGFVMVGIVLGLLNTFVRPVLKILGFPFVFATMGLFLLVINAAILYFTQYFFNDLFAESLGIRFDVGDGVASYLLAIILLSLANTFTHWILRVKK